MDIYKRMAAKNKTCRKRQCKRGTVKWREGGTKYPVVEAPHPAHRTGQQPVQLSERQRPQSYTSNPLRSATKQLAAPESIPTTQRQTTLVSSSTPAAPRTPAIQRPATQRPAEPPATQRPATKRQTQTATPKKISLDEPTPARQSLKTETQNGNSYSRYHSEFDYKDEKYSDIKNYVDFKKLPNREIKTEDDIKNAAVDMKDPQAKIFNDYIKSRYKYFISKDNFNNYLNSLNIYKNLLADKYNKYNKYNKYSKFNPLRYYYSNAKKEYINAEKEYINAEKEYINAEKEYINAEKEYINAEKEYINAKEKKERNVDRGRFLVNEDKPKPMNTKPVNTKPGYNHETI